MLTRQIESRVPVAETMLQNLEPDVFRQRLLFEGHFGGSDDRRPRM